MNEKYSFEDQRPDEDVVFLKKRHPWVLARTGFIVLILVIILVVAIVVFGFSNVSSIIIIGIIIFGLIYIGYSWFLFNNYLYILTNQRIIIIEQSGLFSRKISETELDKIQNVTVEVKGPTQTFMNFGDIKITTAGIVPETMIENIEDPYKIQQEIIKYSKKVDAQDHHSQSNVKIIR